MTSSRSQHVVRIVADDAVGTGCVVGTNLILTALHVVWPEFDEGGELAATIEVDGHAAKLIWPSPEAVGAGTLDAALLQWDDNLRSRHATVEPEWQDGMKFETFGCAGSVEGDSWVPIKGTTCPHRSDPRMGHVSTGQRPADSEDWPGASGAPVLVGDSVRGVVILRQRRWPELLDVVLCSVLLQDARFADFVASGARQRLADRIGEKQKALAAHLASAEPRTGDMRAMSLRDGLDWIDRVHQHVAESDSNTRTRTGCDLALLARLLVAYTAPTILRVEDGVIVVSAVSAAGVEMIRARRDATAVHFEPLSIDAQSPDPRDELRIPAGPDTGPNALPFADAAHRHLTHRFNLPDATTSDLSAWFVSLRKLGEERGRFYFVQFGSGDTNRERAVTLARAYEQLRVFLREHPSDPGAEYDVILRLNSIVFRQQQLEQS